MEINGYMASQKANNINNVNNLKIQKQDEGLDMQDFLNLLVAQITNQDAMNPMDNTEFIAQMAQFSTLQAMSDLTELAMQGQATSLIGKSVIVANYDNRGQLIVDEGIVQRVTLHSGSAKLYVNDTEYEYSNVMEIKEGPKPEIAPDTLITETPVSEEAQPIDEIRPTEGTTPVEVAIPTEEIPPTEEMPTNEEIQ